MWYFTHMAATLPSWTWAADGASKPERLNWPGITAKREFSLDTHAHRLPLNPEGIASS